MTRYGKPIITIRMTSAERERLNAEAGRLGISLNQFCLERLLALLAPLEPPAAETTVSDQSGARR